MSMPTERRILLWTLCFACKEFRKIWVAFCDDKVTRYRRNKQNWNCTRKV